MSISSSIDSFSIALIFLKSLPEWHVIKVNSPLQRWTRGLITRAQIKILHKMIAVQKYCAFASLLLNCFLHFLVSKCFLALTLKCECVLHVGVLIAALVPVVHQWCDVAPQAPELSAMPVDSFGLTGCVWISTKWYKCITYSSCFHIYLVNFVYCLILV